ncbi:MAG: cytochrome c-type biogenesis protein [Caulobacteraceae bacterium]|jgi:cytochrome c-type biogenesis protein CcmH
MRRATIILAAALTLAAVGDPADRLADPVKEARARSLFRETRCVVCQGESIDDSDAPLAADLRRLVRAQVASGRTDGQIRGFLVARYGDFVLFRPPLSWTNLVLWVGPFLVALGGLALLITRERRPPAPPAAELSAEDEAKLARLAAGDDT